MDVSGLVVTAQKDAFVPDSGNVKHSLTAAFDGMRSAEGITAIPGAALTAVVPDELSASCRTSANASAAAETTAAK